MVNSERIRNFKDLKIWQEAVRLTEEIYRITKGFPREEMYGLVNQMQRATVSIPSNIAEGFMRHHNKEFKQFLFIALSSSAEVETQLIISKRLDYVTESELATLSDKINGLNRMIMSLIKKL